MGLIAPQQIRAVLTDRRRLGPFLVALIVYGFAGVTVPLLLLCAGGWWLPKTVDTDPHLSTVPAVVINVALLALFGLQHSGIRLRPGACRPAPGYPLITASAAGRPRSRPCGFGLAV